MTRWLPAAQAFGVATFFYPYFAGGAVSPRWALASASLYFVTLPAILWLAYVFAVLDLDAFMKWAILTGAFCWGMTADATVRRYVVAAFAAGVAVSSVLAVLQAFGWTVISQASAYSGLFGNKNVMGETACLAFVLAWRDRDRISIGWALACLPALILSTCKSAWLATAISLLLLHRVNWWCFVLAGVAAVYVFVVGNGSNSLFARLAIWNEALLYLRPFGAGTPIEPLHNEFIQLPFELGVGALVPLGVLYLVALRDHVLVVCISILSSFGFPVHVPASGWFIAFMCGAALVHLPAYGGMALGTPRPRQSNAVIPVASPHSNPQITLSWSDNKGTTWRP